MTPYKYAAPGSRSVFEGRVASTRADQVMMPDGGVSQRDVL